MRRRRTSYQRRTARRANGYVRRRYTSRRGYYRRAMTRTIARNPITADIFFVKMRYSALQNITNGSVAAAKYIWRGNSIYDPDYTGTGLSVSGFAQYMGLYSAVVVLGSKINIKIINGSNQMLQQCIFPTLDVAEDHAKLNLREIPYGKTSTSGIFGTSTSNNVITTRNYMSTSKMYCASKQEVKDNALYQHGSVTNPTNTWWWILMVNAGAVTTLNWTQDVTITYYVMFKRRQELVTDS